MTEVGARSRKVAILADLLQRLEPHEVPIAVGFSGAPRQGRVGVGYSTIYGLEHEPAAEASLAIEELDRAMTEVQATTGPGSRVGARRSSASFSGEPRSRRRTSSSASSRAS